MSYQLINRIKPQDKPHDLKLFLAFVEAAKENVQASIVIEAFMWLKLNLEQLGECYEVYAKDHSLNIGALGSDKGIPIHFESYTTRERCVNTFKELISEVEQTIQWAQTQTPCRLAELADTLTVGCCIESHSRCLLEYYAYETGRLDPTLTELFVKELRKEEQKELPGLIESKQEDDAKEVQKYVKIFKYCIGRRIRVLEKKEIKFQSLAQLDNSPKKFLTFDELAPFIEKSIDATLTSNAEQLKSEFKKSIKDDDPSIQSLYHFRIQFLSLMEKGINTNIAFDKFKELQSEKYLKDIIPFLTQEEMELTTLVFTKTGLFEQTYSALDLYPGKICSDQIDSVLEKDAFHQAVEIAEAGEEDRNKLAEKVFIKMVEKGADVFGTKWRIIITQKNFKVSFLLYLLCNNYSGWIKKIIVYLDKDKLESAFGEALLRLVQIRKYDSLHFFLVNSYSFKFKGGAFDITKRIFNDLVTNEDNVALEFLERINNKKLHGHGVAMAMFKRRYEFTQVILDRFKEIDISKNILLVKALFENFNCDTKDETEIQHLKMVNKIFEKFGSDLYFKEYVRDHLSELFSLCLKNYPNTLETLMSFINNDEVFFLPLKSIFLAMDKEQGRRPWFDYTNFSVIIEMLYLKQPEETLAYISSRKDLHQNSIIPILYLALKSGRITDIYSLLKLGTLNAKSIRQFIGFKEGQHAILEFAAKSNHFAVVKLLLDAKVSPNIISLESPSPLCRAASANYKQIVQLLLENKADPNQSMDGAPALWLAAKKDSRDIVELLIEAKAAINKCHRSDGSSPLAIAAANNAESTVNYLLEAKADFSLQRKDGSSAVLLAAKSNFTGVLKSLLLAQANPSTPRNDSKTALFFAGKAGYHDVVKLLFAGKRANCIELGKESKYIKAKKLKPVYERIHSKLWVKLDNFNDLKTFHALNRVNKNIHEAINIPAQWEKRLVTYFPHHHQVVVYEFNRSLLKNTMSHDLEKEWQREFQIAYEEDYKGFTTHQKQFFSLVKEGNLSQLKQSTTYFEDFYIKDASKYTMVNWANKKKYQEILDYFYDLMCKFLFDQKDKLGYCHFHWAIECNQVEEIKSYFLRTPSRTINLEPPPLNLAAYNGDLFISRLLLQHKADVNFKGKESCSPFMIAAFAGHTELVREFLKNSADINQLSDEGYSPLYLSVKNGHFENTKLLIENKADMNQTYGDKTVIYLAAQKGYIEILKLLIMARGDVNQARNGIPPLYKAVERGLIPVVSLLIKSQANVDFNTTDGSALMFAVNRANSHITKLLLNAKADINGTYKSGLSLLSKAVQNKSADIVQLLLDQKADPNQMFVKRKTLLHTAIDNNDLNTVEQLIQAGAKVNQFSENKEATIDVSLHIPGQIASPLGLAIKVASTPMVKLLIDSKAKLQDQSLKYGPLFLVALKGRLDLVQPLLEAKADINQECNEITPLRIAMRKKDLPMIQCLIESKADLIRKHDNTCLLDSAINADSILEAILLLKEEIKRHINILNKQEKYQESFFAKLASSNNEKLVAAEALQAVINKNSETLLDDMKQLAHDYGNALTWGTMGKIYSAALKVFSKNSKVVRYQ